MRRYDFIFLILSGIFLSSLVIANSLVFKFFDVSLPFVGVVTLSVGTIPYPVTFLCTDLISELYGKKRADALVLTGLLVSGYLLLVMEVGRIAPVSRLQDAAAVQGHYEAVFGQSTRAIFASMVAYLMAQFLDVRLYHFWRRLTNGKHLWLRNNGSTMLSQLVDTAAVVTILFYGVWTQEQIAVVIASGYAFKLLVALLDTPLLYLTAHWLRDIEDESRAQGLIGEAA